jgi:N-acetylmuramoyl-L-alanine amidase
VAAAPPGSHLGRIALLLILLAVAVPSTAGAATPILGPEDVSADVAQKWARARGATPTFVRLAAIYWRLAPKRGVRPEVAYVQAAKETNYGRFTGVLDASFHNPCGLKRRAGGGNYDRSAHKRFPTWRAGIAAHLDHIALYAGADGYPRRSTPDPRHFAFLRGRARSVERLGGNWAPSRAYGRDVAQLARALVASAPDGGQSRGQAPAPRGQARGLFPVPLGFVRAVGTTI